MLCHRMNTWEIKDKLARWKHFRQLLFPNVGNSPVLMNVCIGYLACQRQLAITQRDRSKDVLRGDETEEHRAFYSIEMWVMKWQREAVSLKMSSMMSWDKKKPQLKCDCLWFVLQLKNVWKSFLFFHVFFSIHPVLNTTHWVQIKNVRRTLLDKTRSPLNPASYLTVVNQDL